MRNDTKLAIAASLNSVIIDERDLLDPAQADNIRASVRRNLHDWHDAEPQSSRTHYRGEVMQDYDAAETDEIVELVRNLQSADNEEWKARMNSWIDEREQ